MGLCSNFDAWACSEIEAALFYLERAVLIVENQHSLRRPSINMSIIRTQTAAVLSAVMAVSTREMGHPDP